MSLVYRDVAACSDRGSSVQLQPEGRAAAEDVPVHIVGWRCAGNDTDTGHHRQAMSPTLLLPSMNAAQRLS